MEIMEVDSSDGKNVILPTITPRKSDRGVKTVEGMVDILIDDINRYEALSERDQLMALHSLFAGEDGADDLQLEEIPMRVSDVQDQEQTDISAKGNDELKRTIDIKAYLWRIQTNSLWTTETKTLDQKPSRTLTPILCVRRRGGNDYEPDTLTGVQNRIDRYLKDKKIQIDLKKDERFNHSRRVLEAKRKELKSKGKGNKRNKAESIESEEIDIMYKKQLLGPDTNPEALLNTVWLNNGVFFGFRGRQEHTTLLLGDLEFKKDATCLEYVEFNERSTKTRNGKKSGDQRAVAPKMFAQPEYDYCPVKMLRLYISKRPEDMRNDPSSRFYLRPLTTTTSDVWYSHQPIGKNKLELMMKN